MVPPRLAGYILKTPFRNSFFIILLALFIITPHLLHSSPTMYGIQVDEFKDLESAESRVNSLKQLGHDAFYRCETVESGETTCRVFVDQFETQAEAEEEAAFLEKLDLIKNFSIYPIVDKPPLKEPKPAPSTPSTPPISQSSPTPSPFKSPVQAYHVQVGSFQDKTNADYLFERLKQAGYSASVQYETVKGKGNYYRVYVTGYESQKTAENAAQALKKSGIISGYAVRATDEKPPVTSTRPKDGGNAFFLHVGSYQDRNNAEKLIQALKRQGNNAFFVAQELSTETWFRVYIDGFDNEKSALQVGTKLQAKGLISYYKIIGIK